MQQTNFTENLDQGGYRQTFFIIKGAKETALNFSKRAVKLPWFYFVLR